MNRMLASLATAAALVATTTSPGSAQAPSAELMSAFSGTWHIDRERSEPLPAVARSLVDASRIPGRQTVVETTAVVVTGATPPTSAGGRRGGGGSAPGSGSTPAPPRARGMGGGANARYLGEMASELAPPPTLVITATESEIVLANTAGAEIRWAADGRVHQHAQMDGTMLEESAAWKGDKIELHNGVHGALDLKRELKLVEKGTVLELKIEIGGPGMPKKVTRKVYFTR